MFRNLRGGNGPVYAVAPAVADGGEHAAQFIIDGADALVPIELCAKGDRREELAVETILLQARRRPQSAHCGGR